MIVAHPRAEDSTPREPSNTALLAPLAALVLLAVALLALGWPTAAAGVAMLGGLYVVGWFALAAQEANREAR